MATFDHLQPVLVRSNASQVRKDQEFMVSYRLIPSYQSIINRPSLFVICSSSLMRFRCHPPLPSPSSASNTLPPSTNLTSLELGLKLPFLAHLKLPFVFVKHALRSILLSRWCPCTLQHSATSVRPSSSSLIPRELAL